MKSQPLNDIITKEQEVVRGLIEKGIIGIQTSPLYTAEELQKNFIRQTCEGYDKNDRALINQADLKGWFEWLASLKIIKEHGFGIE